MPVYLYDDDEWLPYKGTNYSVDHIAFSGQQNHVCKLMKTLAEMTEKEYEEKLTLIKDARRLYTYQGVLEQLELFFRDPFGEEGGELRCTSHPGIDHR